MASSSEPYPGHENTINAPVHSMLLMTAHDTAATSQLAAIPKGIHIGSTAGSPATGGIIRVLFKNQTVPVDLYVLVGRYYPYRIQQLYATSLTAGITVHACY